MNEFIKECRESSKLTLKQISKLLNVSVHTYLAMEQGKIQFRTELIEMLSRIYQIELSGNNLKRREIERIKTDFSSLNDEERFFLAMKNLTGIGKFTSNYREIRAIKNDIINKQRKSAH